MPSVKDYSAQEDITVETKRRLGRNELFLSAITLVTLVSFITLLFTVAGLAITYQHDNAQSYQEYRDELRLQNDKIDSLTRIINEQKTIPEAN